jgi:anti-sigma regulatory factor (Ser/Thr protein kinase)
VSVPRETRTFAADQRSSRDARRFAEDWLDGQGLRHYRDRVPLAVSELAANAVLHTGQPFTITLSGDAVRVRAEIVDSAPQLVPVASPLTGTAADITALSETGRGLVIAGSLANRWGMTLAPAVKTLWCEFDDWGQPATITEPVIEDKRTPAHDDGHLNHLHFIGLPVRTAIASGLDLEDAIRDARAVAEANRDHPDDVAGLLELVDRSMTLRLAGRHGAMHAASQNETRFDMHVELTDDALFATGELAAWLAQRADGRRGPGASVLAFRTWLNEETARQRRGLAPTECPLPAE